MNGAPAEELLPPFDGVRAVNSTEFAEVVVRLQREGRAFVALTSGARAEAGAGLGLLRRHEPGPGGGWVRWAAEAPSRGDEIAQVVFTSGTEGAAKAIVLTRTNTADVVERLTNAMDLDGSLREYVGVPVYYSFGLGRLRACAAVGGSAYIPPGGFNPAEVARMLRGGEINAISAVPTLWRTVLSASDAFRGVGEAVRWIEIGSQYMPRHEKERLREMFPRARILQHYGLTEASRTTFLDVSAEVGEDLESVGRPTGAAEVSISPDGRVRIRGSHVARHQILDGRLVALCGEDGWLCTNDAGRLDRGYLFYGGRADDIINFGGVKLSPDAVEARLLARLGIAGGVAVARTDDALRGDGVLVVVEPEAGCSVETVRAGAMATLSDLGLQGGAGVYVEAVRAIPRTANGKVRRGELRRTRSVGVPASAATEAPATDGGLEARLTEVWRRALGVEHVSRGASFYDLGGDSLSAIGMLVAIERAGLDPSVGRRVFNGESIEQICAGAEQGRPDRRRLITDGLNTARGLLVLLLIGIHWAPGILKHTPGLAASLGRLPELVYRIGTPGFAMMFGVALGYFRFSRPHLTAAQDRRWARTALALLAAAVLAKGIVQWLLVRYAGVVPDAPLTSFMFYSVLAYYLAAATSVPLWSALVRRGAGAAWRCLFAALACFAMHAVVLAVVPSAESASGVVDLLRLVIQAKYGYFWMTGCVMTGATVGFWLQAGEGRTPGVRELFAPGLACAAGGLLLAMEGGLNPRWASEAVPPLPALVFYFGLIWVLLATCVRWCSSAAGLARGPRAVTRVVAALGVLSLPMYVGHSLVIPVKDLLRAGGLPYAAATGSSLAVFGLISILLIRRVLRIS